MSATTTDLPEPSKRKRTRTSPASDSGSPALRLDNIASQIEKLSGQFCSVVYAAFMSEYPVNLNPYLYLFANLSRDLHRLEPLSSMPYALTPQGEDLSALNDRLAKAVLLLEKRLTQLPQNEELPATQVVSSDSDDELCKNLMHPFDRETIDDSSEDELC